MARARKTDVLVIRVEQVEAALEQVSLAIRRLRADLDELTGGQTGSPTHLARSQAEPRLRVLPPPDPGWVPVVHRMRRADLNMPDPCDQVGLYLTKPPRQHERASFDVMRILPPGELRWRLPKDTDVPRCSSCGAWIDPFSNADLDYLSVMQPSPGSDPSLPPLSPPSPYRSAPSMSAGYPLQTPAPETVLDDVPQPGRPFPAHTPEAADRDLQSIQELADAIGQEAEPGVSS